jgi:hypothetical protein
MLILFHEKALADDACAQCLAFVVEACRTKAMETRDVINGVNDILMNRDADAAYSPQLDMLMNYPSELKAFGSGLVDSTKSLSKLLVMIHKSKASA